MKWKPEVIWRNPESLIPYARNSRVHSKEQVDELAGLIAANGFTVPIIADKEDVIIAGHGRREAALKLGLQQVPVIVADHLDEHQIMAYRIADNKITEKSTWDLDMLKFDLGSLSLREFDMKMTGFDLPELETLLPKDPGEGSKPSGGLPGADPDAVPPTSEIVRVKVGDIWTLGNHRLMCGDSTSLETVEQLMNGEKADMVFTDPPYGVGYQSNMRTKSDRFDVIENDETFLSEWVNVLPVVSKGWVFVWTTWKVIKKWIDITAPIGDMSNLIVWDKGGGGIGDLSKTFSTDHELALVFNRGAEITGKRLGSVWSVGKDRAIEYVHPTQKPVELGQMALENCTRNGASVLDLFGGSGSTLIACEKSNRRCFMMELDPHYCDVILERWARFTGKDPVREDGKLWSELKSS